jgi:hypothetical protein
MFDRSCYPYKGGVVKNGKFISPECPSTDNDRVEGVCNRDLSANNADTWAVVAAGLGWDSYCTSMMGLPKDLPELQSRRSLGASTGRRSLNVTAGRLHRRDCYEDDSLPFDDPTGVDE